MQIFQNKRSIEKNAERIEERYTSLQQDKVDKAVLNEMVKRIDGNITEIKAMLTKMEHERNKP